MDTSKLSAPPRQILWADGSALELDIGWGAVLWREGKPTLTLAGGERLLVEPGHGSEVAEWYAAAEGLHLIRAKGQPVWLLSDCQSVVDFVNGLAEGTASGLNTYIARVGSHAFFQLGHAVCSFSSIRALKVKGHAGSPGNEFADKLAKQGRESRSAQKSTWTSEALIDEVAVLRESQSTGYAVLPVLTTKTKSRRDAPPRLPKPPAAKKSHKPAEERLSLAQIRELTVGLEFSLTVREEATLAARTAELMRKAEALPVKKSAQRTKRQLALHRAKLYAKNVRSDILATKRRDAALQRKAHELSGL